MNVNLRVHILRLSVAGEYCYWEKRTLFGRQGPPGYSGSPAITR